MWSRSKVPRVVLFDLGGVLLPFDRERRVRAIRERTGMSAEAARAFMAGDIHQRLDRGEADEADLAAAFSALAGREVGVDEACGLILSVFEAPNTELWDLAKALSARLTVGGFSDNPRFVRKVFPPGATLEPLFLSADLGVQKPAPEAFATVQARLGVPASDILFIDDTAANVDQARAMGWEAVAFDSNSQLFGELRARGLS